MLIKGEKIEKNKLKYYVNKQIFVEWKFEAFMKDTINLCNVKNGTSFENVENNQIYSIDNHLIDCIYEVKEIQNLSIVNQKEKTYKYIVVINKIDKCNEIKGIPIYFEFKKINSKEDMEQFKKSFIKQIKKEDVNTTSIEFISINLLNYNDD